MSHNRIEIERRGRVLTARLTNPPHGFMDAEMVAALERLVGSLEGDEDLGAVIFTGAQPNRFVTHYDVAEILAGTEVLGAEVGSRVAGATLAATGGLRRVPGVGSVLKRTQASGVVALQQIHELFLRMNRLDKVLIAAIGGPAMGGGCELALACDLRLMARGSGRIGLPETTLGLQPGAGGTQRLSHAVGATKALELILEGRALEPEEALELGLINRVCDADALVGDALEIAGRMARRSPASIRGAKHSIYFGASSPLAEGLAEERRHFLSVGSTEAARRGMAAYAEQVERGGRAPWADEGLLAVWQEGTAVDLNEADEGGGGERDRGGEGGGER